MTFNAAFPSSPLSRSALRGDTGLSAKVSPSSNEPKLPSSPLSGQPSVLRHVSHPRPSGDREEDAADPSTSTLVHDHRKWRRTSQPNSLYTSHLTSGHASSTTNQPLAFSNSPHSQSRNRDSGAWSPDSAMNAFMATSPVSPPTMRPSPNTRSPPGAGRNKRFSSQSFGLSPTPNLGSLIGSYEESLLSGRMSTPASRPLTFDAELGVLGLGKCKSALKCPPHLNLKFPAHFYSLEGALEKEGKNSLGSPYVGTIDIEGHYFDELLALDMDDLEMVGESDLVTLGKSSREFQHRSDPFSPASQNVPSSSAEGSRPATQLNASGRTPSFPGYRIPPKGQIQLVIKNPNLTAVKLFLVPYDFTDMPPGTKTFIRQKSHVATPPPSSEATTFGNSRSPSPSPSSTPGKDFPRQSKETLRYAIHLQFCSLPNHFPSKARRSEAGFDGLRGGEEARTARRPRASHPPDANSKNTTATKIYLHKAIRVVFAARVPDKTEKLSVVAETPGGTKGKKEHMYAPFSGPGDEWIEARKTVRERARAQETSSALTQQPRSSALDIGAGHLLFEKQQTSTVTNPVSSTRTEGGAVMLTDEIINSDPNGERWDESKSFTRSSDENMESKDGPEAVDIPGAQVSHPLSWAMRGEEGVKSRSEATDGFQVHPTPVDDCQTMISRRSSRADRTAHIDSPISHSATRPPASQNLNGSNGTGTGAGGSERVFAFGVVDNRSVSPTSDHSSDDRALLESWHHTLALRPRSSSTHLQQMSLLQRAESPSSNRFSATSSFTSSSSGLGTERNPMSQPSSVVGKTSTRRPTSPTSGIYNGRLPSQLPISPHRPRHFITPPRTASPCPSFSTPTSSITAPVANESSVPRHMGSSGVARPSGACLDLEPVSGVMTSLEESGSDAHRKDVVESGNDSPMDVSIGGTVTAPAAVARPSLMRRLSSQPGASSGRSSPSSSSSYGQGRPSSSASRRRQGSTSGFSHES